jgi:hypothetical protein
MALTKDQILDGIAELTVLELKDLLDAFEEKFGVTAAAPAAVAVAGGGAAAPEASKRAARRRFRSSRSCASSPAWASKKPKTWSMALQSQSSRRSARTMPPRQRPSWKRPAQSSNCNNTTYQVCGFGVFGPEPQNCITGKAQTAKTAVA